MSDFELYTMVVVALICIPLIGVAFLYLVEALCYALAYLLGYTFGLYQRVTIFFGWRSPD